MRNLFLTNQEFADFANPRLPHPPVLVTLVPSACRPTLRQRNVLHHVFELLLLIGSAL